MEMENTKEFAKEILCKQMKIISEASIIAVRNNDYVGLKMLLEEIREIALTLVRLENSK